MSLVIADTSPIRYLIQVGQIDLLQRLLETITIPAEVASELADLSAPPAVQAWIKSTPAWVSVVDAVGTDDPDLSNLDPGERAAIALGITLKADLILIDERRGYATAVRKGIEVTGTLGILDIAAKGRLINLEQTIERLKQTNFRYRKEIIEELVAQHRDR